MPVSVSLGLAPHTTITNTAVFSVPLLIEPGSASLALTIANHAPQAAVDAFTVLEDSTSGLEVLANDNDADGDALIANVIGIPDHGGTLINGSSVITYTPALNFVGTEVFTYIISDGYGGEDTAQVTLTVTNLNDPPIFTSAPVFTATQDTPYTYSVTATDPDLTHGDSLTITAATLPAWLMLSDHGDGTAALSGTPGNAQVGSHTVMLSVTDSPGLVVTQTFTLTVTNLNAPPAFTSTPSSLPPRIPFILTPSPPLTPT